MNRVSVQEADFDPGTETEALTVGRTDVGAVATFVGLVRADKLGGESGGASGEISAMTLEHYPGMAEAEIRRICVQAVQRFSLNGLTAIHRHGRIAPGGRIVLVAAAAPHRQAAFDGAAFVMDYLKTSAPFWKKEHALDGTAGQNAHSQVEIFREMVKVDALVITKLDGSSKGGVVVSLAERFKLPIVAVGVGEGVADLQPFVPQEFARALMGVEG